MMNGFKYKPYVENKPHYLRMVVWRVINVIIFPLLGKRCRLCLLRCFGAQVAGRALIYRSVRIYAPWNLLMANGVVIGPRVRIYNKDLVLIGTKTVISQDSFLCTASHDIRDKGLALITKPITIKDFSWLAAKSVILPGVTIGEGAVVAACAVVSKDVAPWTMVGGNPAKEIKKRVLNG